MKSGKKVLYAGINRNSFRPNEYAEVIGVEWVTPRADLPGRACFRVQYDDGFNDLCPIDDSDNYVLIPSGDPVEEKTPIASIDPHSLLQIQQAARGCISGTSDEWPHLVAAIEEITGKQFVARKSASWLQGFCEAIMSMRAKDLTITTQPPVYATEQKKYRKKPSAVVKAYQWFKSMGSSTPGVWGGYPNEHNCVACIAGDGLHFYPCKPDIFAKIYEPVV